MTQVTSFAGSFALTAMLFLASVPIQAQAQEPRLRSSLAEQSEIWTGQRVVWVVEILAPGYFAGTPAFDLPQTSGLLLMPPSGNPVISSETIDDTSFTIQRHELSVIAPRPGDHTLPPCQVRFHFKRNPLDHDPVSATLSTPPLSFTAKSPPGAEKLGSVISARDLKATETWKPQPDKAKPGDAFTRTITITAPDIPAMALPAFPVADIEGLGIYRKPPEVSEHDERGELTSQRREVITYVCQRPGHYTIPGSKLTWFDLDSQQLQTINFPACQIEIPAPPSPPQTAASTKSAVPSWKLITGGLAVLLALSFFWRFRASFRPVHLAPLNPPPSS